MCMYFAAFTIICVVISALSVSSAMGKFRKEGLTKHSLRPILDWRKCIVLGSFDNIYSPSQIVLVPATKLDKNKKT